ncbi:MAG TPA: SMP-30/gluconolactonase/LRE family protein [Candidatus Sulfotelmatobacter sp.]|nr:SMP-30/gluconolactonase/LRE family protein [Candidatus Sulfotelmatobacter sp.]
MSAKLEVLLNGLKFGEGPRWRDGKLWFSDFYAYKVMTVDLRGRTEVVAEVPTRPSGLGWTPDGTLLVVSMLDHRLLAIEGKRQRVVADLTPLVGGLCNDMVVDGKGRAYVGNFGFDRHRNEAPRTTVLVRVDPDGRMTAVADELMFPNGTVISPDGKTLIVAETFAGRLTAFDVAADGSLGNRRIFAEIEDCWPDGICLDAEGAVWVTNPRGHAVLRVFEGGRIAETVSTGERHSYACMLGGADRRTLFVITNSNSGPAMEQKNDGRIETVRVAVPGAGWP